MSIIKSLKICIPLSALLLNIPADANKQQQLSHKNNIAKEYIIGNYQKLGIALADINNAKISSYQTQHNGLTHIYFRQYVNGIEMYNGNIQVHLDRNNKVFLLHNQFTANLASKINTSKPTLKATVAINRAITSLNLVAKTSIILKQHHQTPNQSALYSNAGISLADIPVKLVYTLNKSKQVRLAWDLQIQQTNAWWNIRVDAVNAEVLDTDNWTSDGSYAVFPQPFESPDAAGASHQVVSNVADAIASPFGWHDTDGIAGAEFTDTQGNNVRAQDDLDANNSGGLRPDGDAALDFNFSFDENLQPDEGTNLEAGIVNLFYWNNIIHDIMYRYGFDEAAGNFQINNYGNGGLGNDAVNADAQDGSGVNNANFATPPDGFAPRMQMFRFLAAPSLTVTSPTEIAGDYAVGSASFGATIDATGLAGILEEVNDNTDTTSDACEPLVGFNAGKIALLDRGDCQFGVKVRNAELAGAIAAIVINNQGDDTMTMGPGTDGALVTIPSVFIGQSDGNLLREQVNNTVDIVMTMNTDRAGDFDNGIIIHEYGHGVSNRLTGGAAASGCVSNEERMGEGWSDFFALVLTAQSTEQATDARAMGQYARNSEFGIRQYPYATDMIINPHTFADIDSVSVPHGVGSVWAVMLWEVYWNLVATYGFDADLYSGTGGNNIMLQLVIDGLKLQPCNPSFIQGRDAILAADVANNASANQCAIWQGFAKRGLGLSANSGSGFILGDEIEAFDIPKECMISDLIFTDGFE